jgi:hypothetical protein
MGGDAKHPPPADVNATPAPRGDSAFEGDPAVDFPLTTRRRIDARTLLDEIFRARRTRIAWPFQGACPVGKGAQGAGGPRAVRVEHEDGARPGFSRPALRAFTRTSV